MEGYKWLPRNKSEQSDSIEMLYEPWFTELDPLEPLPIIVHEGIFDCYSGRFEELLNKRKEENTNAQKDGL